MKKLFDLAVKTETYEIEGEKKNKYLPVGVILEGEYGPFIRMDRTFNPAGLVNPENRTSIIISMFKPRDDKKQSDYMDSSIPF
jgi:hypothetical protein